MTDSDQTVQMTLLVLESILIEPSTTNELNDSYTTIKKQSNERKLVK